MHKVLRPCWIKGLGGVSVTFTFCAVIGATPITGGFGTTAAGVLTFANTTNTVHFIDWCPTDPTSPPTGSGTCGTANTGLGSLLAQGGSGSFASLIAPSAGTIKDMVDTGSFPPFTTFPAGVGVSINNYLTLSALPQFNFRAEFLVPETCAPSASTVCIGPFILTQVGGNVTVSMSVNGTVLDTSGTFTPAAFSDVISGQFNSTTIAAVAAAAQTTTGIFSNTWSGSVSTTAVPEPSTIYLACGVLLAGFGIVRRRRG